MRPIRLAAALCAMALLALPPSASARTDWPMLLMTAETRITVPPPPDAARTAEELAALRAGVATRAPDLAQRLRRWENAGPVTLWNAAAIRALDARGMGNAPASRVLALLHVTLYDVSLTVAKMRVENPRPSPVAREPSLALAGVAVPQDSFPSEVAAVGAAAQAVLAALIPAEAARFAALAEEGDSLRRATALEFPSDAEAGRAIGQSVAALALARARDDGASRAWTGTIPTGPGRWVGTQPANPGIATWRPWVLPANDALRPSPPPALDSAAAVAALAEVRDYRRTPAALEEALFWHVYGGQRNFQMWHAELARRATEDGLSRDTPRVAAMFAALAMAYHDSHVACWDAKYAYWYIRPSQLDPTITTTVPMASHPAYPSAHSCLTAAGANVLAALFPDDAAHFAALTQRAGEARISSALHYRFDITAGEEIGRRAAELALVRMAPALQ